MKTASDQYEDVALVYTRLVRQESQEAASTIKQIQVTFGAHAALRAALIITILKTEVQQNDWIPSIGLYEHLLEDYPEALPLMKIAIACCLEVWAAHRLAPERWSELAAA